MGGIEVDGYGQTSVEGLYAVGKFLLQAFMEQIV